MPVATAAHRIAEAAEAEYDGEPVCGFDHREKRIHSDRINNIVG